VTRTDAYFGLRFAVTSSLSERAGGTDVMLRVMTRWRRGLTLVGKLVERAILSPAEAQKELDNFTALVEREAPG
jgi:hypothetical protein